MKFAKNLERLGTESAFAILAEAKKIEATGKKMINLGIGQPDFKTPTHVMEAAKKAIDDGHHGYVVSNGIPECREAVCRKIKKLYGADIHSDRIIIMPGGKPTMYFAISMFGEPGAEIIYPDPGFPVYESMINYTGAKAVPYSILDNSTGSVLGNNNLPEITITTEEKGSFSPIPIGPVSPYPVIGGPGYTILIHYGTLSQNENTGLPTKYALHQNYPNPFNPITAIHYDLPERSHVMIMVYDIVGHEIRTLVNDQQNAGFNSITWNGTNIKNELVAGGVYIYTIQFDKSAISKKMVLLK